MVGEWGIAPEYSFTENIESECNLFKNTVTQSNGIVTLLLIM